MLAQDLSDLRHADRDVEETVVAVPRDYFEFRATFGGCVDTGVPGLDLETKDVCIIEAYNLKRTQKDLQKGKDAVQDFHRRLLDYIDTFNLDARAKGATQLAVYKFRRTTVVLPFVELVGQNADLQNSQAYSGLYYKLLKFEAVVGTKLTPHHFVMWKFPEMILDVVSRSTGAGGRKVTVSNIWRLNQPRLVQPFPAEYRDWQKESYFVNYKQRLDEALDERRRQHAEWYLSDEAGEIWAWNVKRRIDELRSGLAARVRFTSFDDFSDALDEAASVASSGPDDQEPLSWHGIEVTTRNTFIELVEHTEPQRRRARSLPRLQ